MPSYQSKLSATLQQLPRIFGVNQTNNKRRIICNLFAVWCTRGNISNAYFVHCATCLLLSCPTICLFHRTFDNACNIVLFGLFPVDLVSLSMAKVSLCIIGAFYKFCLSLDNEMHIIWRWILGHHPSHVPTRPLAKIQKTANIFLNTTKTIVLTVYQIESKVVFFCALDKWKGGTCLCSW